MSDQVKIVISAVDQTQQVFNRLNRSVGDLAKSLVGAFSVWQAGTLIKESALLAARYETLGVVMGVIGNNAGYTRTEMEGFAQTLQQTGISSVESRQVLTQMAAANIDLAESTKLARLAQDAAVIGNTNSSEAFQRLVYGIQSAQVEMLRTIGINVSFENGYKTMAATLGKTTAELTEQEKMQSRLQTVMAAAPQIAGTYEAAMGTVGKQLNSMKRYTDDLKVSLGELFTPALSLAVQQLSDKLKGVNAEMADNKTAAQQWGLQLRTAMIHIEAEAIRITMRIDKIGGTMTSIGRLMHIPQAAIGVQFSKDVVAKMEEWNKLFETRYEANDKRLMELAELSIALENEAAMAGQSSAAEDELEKKRIAAGQAARELAEHMAAEASGHTASSGAVKQHAAEIEKLNSGIKRAVEKLKEKQRQQEAERIEALDSFYALTPEQEMDRVDNLWQERLEREQREAEELAGINSDVANRISETWQQAQRNMTDFSRDFFFDLMKGDIDDLGNRFADMAMDMVANWQAAQLQMAMWGDEPSSGGGFGNGLIAAGVNAVFKGYTQNAGIDAALTDYYNFHRGGLVGRDGSPGRAPSSLWSNAPRLHSGLLPDEFPAILQRGEAVIPRNAVGGIGGNVTINVYNQDGGKKDVEDAKIKFDVRGMVVDVFLRDMAENGPIRQSMGGGL